METLAPYMFFCLNVEMDGAEGLHRTEGKKQYRNIQAVCCEWPLAHAIPRIMLGNLLGK